MRRIVIIPLVIVVVGIMSYMYFGFETEVIKVGLLANLTGESSELGVNAMYGAKLAVEEINKDGGINGKLLELVVKDHKNDASLALSSCEDMFNEGIHYVIGPLTSGMAEHAVPYINSRDMLMISPTVSRNDLTGMDDNFLRLMPINKVQADFVAQKMREEGIRKAAVIHESINAAFAKTYSDYFKREFESLGGSVVYDDSFKNGQPFDVDHYMKALKESDAQSVLFIGNAYDSGMFFQYMAREQMSQKIYLSQWAMTADLLEQSGYTSDGGYIVSYLNQDSKATSYLSFKNKYRGLYGKDPTFVANLAYEAVTVLKEGLVLSDTENPESIKEAIIDIQQFQGLQGQLNINRYGDIMRDIYLYEIRDNAFQLIEE